MDQLPQPMTLSRTKPPAPHPSDNGPGDHLARVPLHVSIELAKRRKLSLNGDASDYLYIVDRGCLTVDASLPDGRRQVMLILYPGEVISRKALAPMQEIHLTAMLPSAVSRVRWTGPEGCGGDPNAASAVTPSGSACLLARAGLHALMIGRLTGEERLTALLIELALFLGTATAGGYTFELPLTRDDMADYLALNPDTLSRLLTRLKARQLISMPKRHRMIIRNFAALAELTPVSDAMQRLRASAS